MHITIDEIKIVVDEIDLEDFSLALHIYGPTYEQLQAVLGGLNIHAPAVGIRPTTETIHDVFFGRAAAEYWK